MKRQRNCRRPLGNGRPFRPPPHRRSLSGSPAVSKTPPFQRLWSCGRSWKLFYYHWASAPWPFPSRNPRAWINAVTLVVRLSNAIVDEIEGEPTLTYFSHYRAVNAFLDQCLLKAGLFLDRAGYQYITVAASQSMNQKGWNYQGRFSHKQAACAAGLGVIGKSSLFLHHRFGPRVRLATLFTDCPFPVENALPASLCGSCRKCVDSCPSGAILGPEWVPGMPRKLLFDPEKCSQHMKRQYQHIGRGAVCGICMRVCPRYERSVIRWE